MQLPNLHPFTHIGVILMAVLTAGCQDHAVPSSQIPVTPAASASQTPPPSFVGTLPQGPTKELTVNPSGVKSDISKSQQSNAMPMPGQANDHSTLAPNASQKANAKNGTP
jgi:hypothetical protein